MVWHVVDADLAFIADHDEWASIDVVFAPRSKVPNAVVSVGP